MKVIDEKGRLFGRINIIDFLALAALIAGLPLVYFGYRIINKPAELSEAPREIKEIEINTKFIKLKPATLALLAVGDKETGWQGQVMGQIIWLGTSAPYCYNFDLGQGSSIVKEDPELKEVPVKLKVWAQVKEGNLYYKEGRLAIGLPFEFQSQNYSAQAVPVAEEVYKIQKPLTMDMDITFRGLSEETAKSIRAGDKETDKEGNVLAEVVRVGRLENEQYDINLGDGQYIKGEVASRRQVVAKMRLLTKFQGGNVFFFKDKKIDKDAVIAFATDKYKIEGRISRGFEILAPPMPEKWMRVRVRFMELIPELVNVISIGNQERDTEGATIGKIALVANKKPSDIMFIQNDKIINAAHPSSMDLEIVFQLICFEKGGVMYYKSYPIKIGSPFSFSTELYSLSGIITGVE